MLGLVPTAVHVCQLHVTHCWNALGRQLMGFSTGSCQETTLQGTHDLTGSVAWMSTPSFSRSFAVARRHPNAAKWRGVLPAWTLRQDTVSPQIKIWQLQVQDLLVLVVYFVSVTFNKMYGTNYRHVHTEQGWTWYMKEFYLDISMYICNFTLPIAPTSAPAFSRTSVVAAWPHTDALWRGVSPYFTSSKSTVIMYLETKLLQMLDLVGDQVTPVHLCQWSFFHNKNSTGRLLTCYVWKAVTLHKII